MAGTDLSLELRQSILAHLRADAQLTALVPAEFIFGEFALVDAPTFIRLGDPLAEAFEASGWSGSENSLVIHAFAQGPGRDAIQLISKRVVAAMEDFEPQNIAGGWAQWQDTQVLPDPIPELLHAVIRFEVTGVELV